MSESVCIWLHALHFRNILDANSLREQLHKTCIHTHCIHCFAALKLITEIKILPLHMLCVSERVLWKRQRLKRVTDVQTVSIWCIRSIHTILSKMANPLPFVLLLFCMAHMYGKCRLQRNTRLKQEVSILSLHPLWLMLFASFILRV